MGHRTNGAILHPAGLFQVFLQVAGRLGEIPVIHSREAQTRLT